METKRAEADTAQGTAGTPEWRKRIGEEIDNLRTLRDELRVQVHLGALEAREEWERLEKRWHQLEGRARALREASRESLEDIGEAAKLLIEEIREGYHTLRERL